MRKAGMISLERQKKIYDRMGWQGEGLLTEYPGADPLILSVIMKQHKTACETLSASQSSKTCVFNQNRSKRVRHSNICDNIMHNPNVTSAIVRELAESTDAYLIASALGSKKVPVQFIRKYADYPDEHVRWAIASNPKTPVNILADYAKDPVDEYDIKKWALRNPSLPYADYCEAAYAIMEQYAHSDTYDRYTDYDDHEMDLKATLALLEWTPVPILEQLADDETGRGSYDSIQEILAGNSRVPADILRKLYDPQCVYTICQRLTTNHNLPEDLLMKLIRDCGCDLYEEIIEFSPLTPRALKELVKHHGAPLARIKSELPDDIVLDLARSRDTEIQAAIAPHDNLPEEYLTKFAKSKSEIVRAGAASNHHLTADQIDELSMDNSEEVRQALAENPVITTDLLRKFALDPKLEIRLSALRNKKMNGMILESMAKDKDGYIRSRVAVSRAVSPEVLTSMVFDDYEDVLLCLAFNPKLADDAFEQLLTNWERIDKRSLKSSWCYWK